MNTRDYSKRLTKILFIGLYLISPKMLLSSAEAEAKPIIVKTIPLALNYKQPEQTRIGPLHYRGGLVILSTKAGFGGFSALGVSSDGKRMIAISDMGYRFAASLIYNKESHLIDMSKTELDSLAKLDGTALKTKADSDIESMSPVSTVKSLLVRAPTHDLALSAWKNNSRTYSGTSGVEWPSNKRWSREPCSSSKWQSICDCRGFSKDFIHLELD